MTEVKSKKELGNAAFHDGKFEEAVQYYSDAIKGDINSALLYNNRAAAYLAMSKFAEALSDAKQATRIDSSSAKAFGRIAEAHRGLGQPEAALVAYRKALELAPGTSRYQMAITEVEARLSAGPQSQSRRASAANPATAAEQWRTKAGLLDIVLIVTLILHLPCLLLAPSVALLLWRFGAMSFAMRQWHNVTRAEQVANPQPSTGIAGIIGNLKKFFHRLKDFATSGEALNTFSGLWMLLSVFLIINGPPMHLLWVAMAIYSLVDCVVVMPGLAVKIFCNFGAPGRMINDKLLLPYTPKITQNRDFLLSQAAMSEVVSACFAPISGYGMVPAVVLLQFIRMRYRTNDHYVRLAFSSLAQTLGRLFYHPSCPPAVGNLFTKFKELLHKFGAG